MCRLILLKKILIFIFVAGLEILLVACALMDEKTDNQGDIQTSQAYFTAAAQTIYAQLTLDTGFTAVAQLTQNAFEKTEIYRLSATPLPGRDEPATATWMPAATLTQTPELACNKAQIVTELGVADNENVTRGAMFDKSWRLRNIGTCDWTPGYELVFQSGDVISNQKIVPLNEVVRPGETISLAVNFVAPMRDGSYRSEWVLRDENGMQFTPQNGVLEVKIRVVTPAEQDKIIYDFIENSCSAEWTSASGSLNCPGNPDSTRGSVLKVERPFLESRRVEKDVLWLRPNSNPNGWIRGIYPEYAVRDSDRLLLDIGCLADSPGCSLIFSIDGVRRNGELVSLGAWQEVYDGAVTAIDINLSFLASEVIQFIFKVINQGDADAANGFLLQPRIENATPTLQRVLVWHQATTSACSELSIYLLEGQIAEAQATNCRSGQEFLGVLRLNEEDYLDVVNWVRVFKPIDVEIIDPQIGAQNLSWMSFRGQGVIDPSNNELNAMKRMAERIFNNIVR